MCILCSLYTVCMQYQQKPEEGIGFPLDPGWEAPRGCWKLNPGTLQEQLVLFTAGPSLLSPIDYFLSWLWRANSCGFHVSPILSPKEYVLGHLIPSMWCCAGDCGTLKRGGMLWGLVSYLLALSVLTTDAMWPTTSCLLCHNSVALLELGVKAYPSSFKWFVLDSLSHRWERWLMHYSTSPEPVGNRSLC